MFSSKLTSERPVSNVELHIAKVKALSHIQIKTILRSAKGARLLDASTVLDTLSYQREQNREN